MRSDAFERLRAQNPVPGLLPNAPIEPILRRLDGAPGPAATSARRSGSRVRIFRVVPLVASAAVAALVAAALLTAGTGQHHPTRPTTGVPTTSKNLTTASGINDQRQLAPWSVYLDHLLPRNGSDWARGSVMTAFETRVRIKAETACMANKGLPGPPVGLSPSARFGSEQFPNMRAIARAHNVGIVTGYRPTNPGASLPKQQRRAYQTGVSRCQNSTASITKSYNPPSTGRLFTDWYRVYATVTRSPQARALMHRGAVCAKKTNFPADSVSQEISNVEAKITPLNFNGARAQAINAAGARVLIHCFGPAQALRDRLMATQRTQFLASHQQALKRVETQIKQSVASDQTKYHVQFP